MGVKLFVVFCEKFFMGSGLFVGVFLFCDRVVIGDKIIKFSFEEFVIYLVIVRKLLKFGIGIGGVVGGGFLVEMKLR